jgi:hypothetical protein
MKPMAIERWHAVVKSRDAGELDALLADGVKFESPVVHTPQIGKLIVGTYLRAAVKVLNNESFRYANEWFGENSAVLEFVTTVDGISINGVDIIEWNAAGSIVSFKVMVRPLKAINMLHQSMAGMLEQMGAAAK